MSAIEYRRHFLVLMPIICVALPLLSAMGDRLPVGNPRDLLLFGIAGTLHSSAVVMSLRQRSTTKRNLSFVLLATGACLAVPLAGAFAVAELFRVLTPAASGDLIVLLALFGGSACAASVYWALVRGFWANALPSWSLAITALLCGLATVLSFPTAGRVTALAVPGSAREYVGGAIPTVAWWLAFSLALYVGED